MGIVKIPNFHEIIKVKIKYTVASRSDGNLLRDVWETISR